MQDRLVVGMAGLWLLAGGAGLAATPEARPLERFEFLQIQMGVPCKIALYAPDQATANRAARAAYRRVKQLNQVFSDYDPDSELMRLCRNTGPGKPIHVSRELCLVLSRAQTLSKQTGGAFDVTVGPLVRLWRKARRSKRLPDQPALDAARRQCGYEALRLDRKSRTVELLKHGMRLDLGGIAKGYAADAALAVLREHGIESALIDAGGDIVVGDPPPGRQGWRIGVAALTRPDAAPDRFVLLQNAAVATSGDAYKHVTIGGIRYSHIVDPQTGLGLTGRTSVTVIARDGLTADSLASAVSVLGRDRGLALIEQTPGTAALFVELGEETARRSASKRFADFELND